MTRELPCPSIRGLLTFALILFIGASRSCNETFALQDDRAVADPFEFVMRPGLDRDSAADFSALNSEAAGSDGFVRVSDGHFATDKGRIRFWGVNFCFGANYPEKSEAEQLARTLAGYGINCVRIHHHETQPSPDGLFKSDGTIDPAQLDKFNYLCAELNKNGIYININLHVGRSVVRQRGMTELSEYYSASGDKHALHFMPEIQNAFWDYCREFMGKENPYRGMTRAQDPGVAMVEILNENKFSRDGTRYLKDAPEPYRSVILERWNGWLTNKYGTDDALVAAWQSDENRVGPSMADGSKISGSGTAGILGGSWILQENGGASPLKFNVADGVLRIEPQVAADAGWHQQLAAVNLSLEKGKLYTLSFDVRADAEKVINFNAATTEGGWRQLGLGGNVTASPEWKTRKLTFTSTETVDGHARVAFDMGGSDVPIEFRNLNVASGADWTLIPDGQSIEDGTLELPDTGWTPAAQESVIEFMVDLERNFYNGTKKVIRDLGCKVPVCTTQINYMGAKLAVELGDYTDLHSYWNHPLFTGRDWDMNGWVVTHEPIVTDPFSNKWPRNSPLMRAAWRVHGIPFTYSEWNVGEPSLPSAGAIPIMGLMASIQDWDAVFFFDYEDGGGRWDSNKLDGFFRINGQPCKLALLGPFGQLYRQAHLPALTEKHASAEGDHYRDGAMAFEKLLGLDPALDAVTGNSPPVAAEFEKEFPPFLKTPSENVIWDARNKERAYIKMDTPQSQSVWGLVGGQEIEFAGMSVKFGNVPSDYVVFVATSRDGKPLSESNRILLTVVNHGENSTMQWNDEKNSLGANWGNGPTITWGVPVALKVAREGKAILHSLDSSGSRQSLIPVNAESGMLSFELGPQWKTLMYELSFD